MVSRKIPTYWSLGPWLPTLLWLKQTKQQPPSVKALSHRTWLTTLATALGFVFILSDPASCWTNFLLVLLYPPTYFLPQDLHRRLSSPLKCMSFQSLTIQFWLVLLVSVSGHSFLSFNTLIYYWFIFVDREWAYVCNFQSPVLFSSCFQEWGSSSGHMRQPFLAEPSDQPRSSFKKLFLQRKLPLSFQFKYCLPTKILPATHFNLSQIRYCHFKQSINKRDFYLIYLFFCLISSLYFGVAYFVIRFFFLHTWSFKSQAFSKYLLLSGKGSSEQGKRERWDWDEEKSLKRKSVWICGVDRILCFDVSKEFSAALL